MNHRKPLPSLEFLRYLFELDEDRGNLVRRVTRAANARAGSIVGTLDGKGYLHVNILDRFYRIHRIVFYMHYGFEPELGIDHINQDKLDNRPSNLRAATDHQNAGNVTMFKHNSSGFRGVSFCARTQRWHAQIKIHGKQTYLGMYDTPEAAARVYAVAAKQHFGEFARVADV